MNQKAEGRDQASDTHASKRGARLAAVQALYQIALTERAAKDIIKDFREHPPAALLEKADGEMSETDQELFADIVNGVMQNAAALDEMIAGAVSAKHSAERLEILLRAILRCGAYELHHHGSTSAGVIINDYVDVTHAFFNAKEPGLVNAILDKLAKSLR